MACQDGSLILICKGIISIIKRKKKNIILSIIPWGTVLILLQELLQILGKAENHLFKIKLNP